MGIATNGVISYINTSKIKSEKIFVDKIANYIVLVAPFLGNIILFLPKFL